MTPATQKKYLIFEVQGTRCAFDLAHIAEVADPPCSWPIPLAPFFLTGAIHVHGSIVAMMDLAFFLGWPVVRKPEKMILIDQSIAALAILVDRVIRIVTQPEIETRNSSTSPFESFTLILPDGDASLLDLAAIVTASENMIL